jgi:hypothetical protein
VQAQHDIALGKSAKRCSLWTGGWFSAGAGMMNASVAIWMFFRFLRWASWIVFLGFSLYFAADQAPHLNSFGHLLPYVEAIMFGAANFAIFAGFFELMMRERAGIARPKFGQIMPGKAEAMADLAR